jgi:hypothetical protein
MEWQILRVIRFNELHPSSTVEQDISVILVNHANCARLSSDLVLTDECSGPQQYLLAAIQLLLSSLTSNAVRILLRHFLLMSEEMFGLEWSEAGITSQ